MRKHAVTVFLTLFAMLIAVTAVQANSIDDIVKVYGEIESVSDDAIVIDGKAFAIDDNTSIDGDPEVGAEAYVLGYTNDAGERIAKRIWVKPVDTATYIYGRISAVSDSEVVIDEQTVVISAETKIRGDLEVGAKAQVIADENEDGTLVASLIAAYGSNNDDHDDNKEYETTTVEGDISAVSDTAITVDTTTFIINEDTEISGDLTVGATARVRGYAEDGGDWIAQSASASKP